MSRSGLIGNVLLRTIRSVFEDLGLTHTIVLCWKYYQRKAGRLLVHWECSKNICWAVEPFE